MRGTITFESAAGRGTIFQIVLPLDDKSVESPTSGETTVAASSPPIVHAGWDHGAENGEDDGDFNMIC